MYHRRPSRSRIGENPITDILRDRLWRQAEDDEAERLHIEVIIDNLAKCASAKRPDVNAARLLFNYAQPPAQGVVTPEQVKEIIENASDEELALIFNMSGGEFRNREQKFLSPAEETIIDVEREAEPLGVSSDASSEE